MKITRFFSMSYYMSRAMRKPDFCLCENKDTYQLRSNCEADQRLCFRYTDSTIHLLLKYEISSVYPSSEATQTSLCQTCSETPKIGFLTAHFISCCKKNYLEPFCNKGAWKNRELPFFYSVSDFL